MPVQIHDYNIQYERILCDEQVSIEVIPRDLGKELVHACNRLGILINLSHLNEQGFWDIAWLSEAPLMATHSNAHALCQLPRNLTDSLMPSKKPTA